MAPIDQHAGHGMPPTRAMGCDRVLIVAVTDFPFHPGVVPVVPR